MHVAAGECITVHFTNRRTVRASFHSRPALGLCRRQHGLRLRLERRRRRLRSRADRCTRRQRDYRLYADTAKLGATLISDFGGATVAAGAGGVATNVDTGATGLYGAIVVAPAGATFTEPTLRRHGQHRSPGRRARPGSRLVPRLHRSCCRTPIEDIGQSHMPYPTEVKGISAINYRSGPAATSTTDGNGAFSATNSGPGGTPATPMLQAYVGDPVEVHALVTPGSEQMHVFGLGGESWPLDPFIPRLQRDAGPRDRPLGDAAGGHPGGCRRRDDRRRHVLRRSATPVHRTPACGASSASCRTRAARSGRSTTAAAPAASATFITLDAVRARTPHHPHDSGRRPSRRRRSSPPSDGPAVRVTPTMPGEGRPAILVLVAGRRGARLAPGHRARSALQAGSDGHGTTVKALKVRPMPAPGRTGRRCACDDRDGATPPPVAGGRGIGSTPPLGVPGGRRARRGRARPAVLAGALAAGSGARRRPCARQRRIPRGLEAIARPGRVAARAHGNGRVVDSHGARRRGFVAGNHRLVDVRLRYAAPARRGLPHGSRRARRSSSTAATSC